MMVTNYPSGIDTDTQLPRIDDNISEIGGDAINALRDAIFAIEKTLGIDPQGTASDLSSRMEVALDDAGNLKAAALASAGLVTLPIDNSQIASNAGIEESKLDLDHGTSSLQTALDSLTVLVTAIQNALIGQTGNLGQHIAHPSAYGRHEAADVDVNDVSSSFDGDTVQVALDDIDTRLDVHITDPVDAHDASAISLDSTRMQTINSIEVQDAIETLEGLELRELNRHRDLQHGNGILGVNDVSLPGMGHSVVVVSEATARIDSGDQDIVKFIAAPPSDEFNRVRRNDRADIVINGIRYTRIIKGTEGTNRVLVYGSIPYTGTGTAVVYRNSEETETPSSLKVAIRNDNRLVRPSVLQVVHPDAPFIISSRDRGLVIDSSNRNIRFKFHGGNGGDTGDIDLYSEMMSFSTYRSTWTPSNIAKVLNENVFAPEKTGVVTPPHYPLIAFEHNGELGIAYDEGGSDGYLEIGTPSSDSANEIMGFVDGQKEYSLGPRCFYDDGYEFESIRKLVDAYAIIDTPDTLRLEGMDLSIFNFPRNVLVRVDGTEAGIMSGTFVSDDIIRSGNDTLIEFDPNNELDFDNPDVNKGIYVRIYADFFSHRDTLQRRTLYELLMDGYEGTRFADFQTSPRVEYEDTPGGGSSMEDVVDIVSVSRGFTESSMRLFYDWSESTIVLGTKGSGTLVLNPGDPVLLPSPSTDEEGTHVRVYDSYGVEYVELELVGPLPGGDGKIDLYIHDPISEEKFIQVATVLNDSNRFSRMDDRRIFGSIGRYDVRDDFTRDLIDYPRSLLRGNGVIRGIGTSSTIGSSSVVFEGGEVLVDGAIKQISKKEFYFPEVSETFNVFVDRRGILRMEIDNFHVDEILTTPTTEELVENSTDTLIAKVTSDGSGNLGSIEDFRRFVGNMDDRLDLIVEENTITHGSFASLQAAFNWITAHDTLALPVSRTVRVRGRILVDASDGPISVPDGVILIGSGNPFAGQDSRSEILVSGSGTFLFTPVGSFSVRDIAVRMDTAASVNYVIGVSSGTLAGISVDQCSFEDFATSTVFLAGPSISGCRITNTDVVGVSGATGLTLLVSSNTLSDCIIDRCKMYAPTGTGIMVTTSSSVSRLAILGTRMEFPDNSSMHRVLEVGSGDADDVMVDNCVFLLGSTSAVFIEGDLKRSVISNSAFLSTGTKASSGVIGISEGSVVRACVFDKIQYGVTSDSGTSKFCIESNTFSNVADGYAVHIQSGCQDVSVLDNVFDTDENPTTFIRVVEGDGVVISGNRMRSSAISGTASGSMILIDTTSSSIHIKNNTMLNASGIDKGFEYGINLNGAGGTVLADHNDTLVEGNILRDFSGPTGTPTCRGINAKNASRLQITNNMIDLCSEPVFLYDCLATHIIDNYLNSGSGTSEKPCLTIDGSSPAVSTSFNQSLFFITGNIFSHIGNLLAMASEVVKIQNIATATYPLATGVGVLSNNVFMANEVSGSSFPILDIDGSADNFQVMGNVFWSWNSTLSALVTYTVAPIQIAGSSCMVALNNLEHLTSPSTGAISMTGDNSMDSMNKGQSYSIRVPHCSVILDTMGSDYGNESAWSFQVGSTDGPVWVSSATSWTQVDGGDGNDTPLYHVFGTDIVPVGATIKSIDITYNLYGGSATTDMHVGWQCVTVVGQQSPTDIRAAQDIAQLGIYTENITPDGSDPVMGANDQHWVELEFQAQPGDVRYHGMVVNYIL